MILIGLSECFHLVDKNRDGNGAVWVGFRPATTRLETRPKKPVYRPAPSALTGTRLTQPDSDIKKKTNAI